METISNYYSAIFTSDILKNILLAAGIFSFYLHAEETIGWDFKKHFKKYPVWFLLFYGAVFFLSIASNPDWVGLKNYEIWYLWYAILIFTIFTIFAIGKAFKSVGKRFIKYIIREIKEDNK